jgi:hypothetical protein
LSRDVNNALIGNWLTTPRLDEKPRLLFLKPYRYYDFYGDLTETVNTCSSLIEYIKEVRELLKKIIKTGYSFHKLAPAIFEQKLRR